MMRITEYFMKHRMIFWSFIVAIIIGGILAFIVMPKLEDPAVSVKQAMVVVPYPGASAHETELKVALMMEEELRALPNVKYVRSECRNGMAIFTVEFYMTVLTKDLEQHFDLLRRKVNDASMKLPQGCYSPIVIDDMMDVYGIFYAFTADGYEYPEMYKYAKLIKRELLGVKGVKRIIIAGNRDEVINIILSKEQISRNGVVPTQIMTTLQGAFKTVNAGKYRSGDEQIPIYVDAESKNEEDIKDLLIQTLDGKTLRLGDIAKVERGYAEPQRNGFYVDGKPALAICIAMESSAIVPDVGKAVDKRLNEVMAETPAGMNTEKIFFQPEKVEDAISSFMWNLVMSVAIVILVLIFTMGFRSGLIIGFGLLLTVAISFPILFVCGTTLQRISLGAFIVAMGMLVDNAVVIMDGILIDRKRGLPPKKYLYRIGNITAVPLLGATIIAASAFICVYLSPDTAGEYARDLFLVLCVSLLASWVLALVQVPVCTRTWMPLREPRVPAGQEKLMNSPVHRFVRKAISYLIGYKKITIATAFVLLVFCLAGMTKVKNMFFPDFEYKQYIVECFFPSATNPDVVLEKLQDMEQLLSSRDDIERIAIIQGGAPARYCLVRPMTSGGDCYGELIIDCKDYNTVLRQIPEVRETLRKHFPEAYVRCRKYNFSVTTSHTVEVEFSGPDPAVLKELSSQAEDIMRKCKYVDPYSVQNNWKPYGKSYVANYVQQDALRSGIGRNDIGNALMAATDGLPIGIINDQDRSVIVNMRVRNEDGSRIENLNDVPVWSMLNLHLSNDELNAALSGGKGMSELQDKILRSTPLSRAASPIEMEWDEDVVMRTNGQRVIEAECDPNTDMDQATPKKVVQSIKDEIEAIELPAGYKMRFIGEGELQKDAISNLLKFIPLTIFIVLAILLLLFNSWKKVFTILLCLPFVYCGITPLLLATNQPMTFMAIIGMMGLIGMMVKNAIVLVDEINRLQTEEKKSPYYAVVEATVSRVRPVLMASLTTIVGMIPLVTDPMYSSMAITIMGGLAVGTLITLILLPVFYSVFFNIKRV